MVVKVSLMYSNLLIWVIMKLSDCIDCAQILREQGLVQALNVCENTRPIVFHGAKNGGTQQVSSYKFVFPKVGFMLWTNVLVQKSETQLDYCVFVMV